MASSDSTTDAPRRAPSAVKAEINVTPLVDVVLVLLIIFMVVAPQMEAGVAVDLPAILNPDLGKQDIDPAMLTLTSEGALFLEKEPIATDDVLTRLERLHIERPNARLVLKADKRLEYGKVRALFKSCQGLGFSGVALQVLDRANQNGAHDGV